MHLPIEQQGIDDAARVVDPDVAQNLDRPSFLGDLHHRHVSAEGVGAPAKGMGADEVYPRFLTGRQ